MLILEREYFPNTGIGHGGNEKKRLEKGKTLERRNLRTESGGSWDTGCVF